MLKKATIMLLILILGFIFCHDVNAALEPKNEITINPFGLFWGSFNIEYEGVLSKKNTLAIRFNFFSHGWGFGGYSGVGIGASYRFFLLGTLGTKAAPAGFWIGPALDIISVSTDYGNYKWGWAAPSTSSDVYVNIACEAGYEWLFENFFGKSAHLVLSPYALLGYRFGSPTTYSGITALGYGGIFFNIVASAGVAF